MSVDVETNYPTINSASQAFIYLLSADHIETAIAGAATIAGLTNLRASRTLKPDMAPGTILLGEWVNQKNSEAFKFMTLGAYNFKLGHGLGSGEWPPENEPRVSVLEFGETLEPGFYRVCGEASAGWELFSYVAVLTAMRLIGAGKELKILKPEIGKSLASFHLVAGSKTVPYPLDASFESLYPAIPEPVEGEGSGSPLRRRSILDRILRR